MRAKEFFLDQSIVSESGLKISDFAVKNSHYWKNFLSLLYSNAPIELVDGRKVRVQNSKMHYTNLSSVWDGSSLARPFQIDFLKQYRFPILKKGDGDSFTLSKVYKSDFIKTGNSENAADAVGNVKFWNFGNLVEGVMGAAVVAKFMNPEKVVEFNDIINVLQQIQPGASSLGSKGKTGPLVPYTMNTRVGNDQLTFVMSLNSVDIRALQMSYSDPDSLKNYEQHEEIFKAYTDAAEYVNTADTIKTAIDRVVGDPNPNTVIIESEGATHKKQTSTKADLLITVDNKRERLLSLKTKTVPQIGQVSGHAFENLEEFFKSTLGFGLPKSFEEKFPQGSFAQVGPKIFETAFPVAYQHMFTALTQTLSGNNDYKEYDFVQQIFKAIQHHATLGEDVIIVYLSPGATKAYTELKIGSELFEALEHFNLYPELTSGTTLKIIGEPITDIGKQITNGRSQEFCQLRSYMQKGSTIRNIVEVKGLLKSLADVENIKQRQQKSPVQTPTQQPDELTNIKKNAGLGQNNQTQIQQPGEPYSG